MQFEIGQRIGGVVRNGEVPLKVLGFHNDGVIVEVLRDYKVPQTEGDGYKAGQVFVADAINLIDREEVKFIPGDPESDSQPAIGWMELGGVSVCLTRQSSSGILLLTLERAPEQEEAVRVRIALLNQQEHLWEGDVL